MKAVLVRSGDYYVDHRRRMAIAHQHNADLFVSIHADAVDDRRANGATVYALSLKGATDAELLGFFDGRRRRGHFGRWQGGFGGWQYRRRNGNIGRRLSYGSVCL